MKVANIDGRAVVVELDAGRVLAIDIADASGGRFGPDPQSLFEAWTAFREWWTSAPAPPSEEWRATDVARLGPPVPRPRQVFAIGLNYASHAQESGVANPAHPPTFTKFPTCISGPNTVVELASETVDWEVELVAVIGREAHRVAASEGWDHVAGLAIGQDLSDRRVQLRPPAPQFSLGKSFPNFGPIGPWVVTPDEFEQRDGLPIACTLNGEVVQSGRTDDLIFGVPALVEQLSAITPLLAGDLIFTGTPGGVGHVRTPPRFLAPGDVLVSTIDGIGSFTTTFT